MLRQELQTYLTKVFTTPKIEMPDSLVGNIHIRFELSIDDSARARAQASAERALVIWNETFDHPEHELWILVYDYPKPSSFDAYNGYLSELFKNSFAGFYNSVETLVASENQDVRVIIGKLPAKQINARIILQGTANLEMGIDPAIDQQIYFFDPVADKAFYMYDDRGCYVWSNNAEKIRDIYMKRNSWIADYHRAGIDRHFND